MTEGAAVLEGSREGARWVNQAPSGADVADWFKSVKLHEGMDHDPWVGGITMIPNKETVRVPGLDDNGAFEIRDVDRMVFTPYVKVETRVAYFWDLVTKREEWVARIEPVVVERIPEPGQHYNLNLPPGFFRFPVTRSDGRPVEYLGCSMRVRVFEKDAAWKEVKHGGSVEQVYQGTPVMEGIGTKQVGLLGRYGTDDNALMKAETGAIGRALGMIGMLVLPGSGVATAEDMHDMTAPAAGQDEAPQQLPGTEKAAPAAKATLKDKAAEMLAELEEHPAELAKVQAWARERKLNLGELADDAPELRGVVKKLEGALKTAKADAA